MGSSLVPKYPRRGPGPFLGLFWPIHGGLQGVPGPFLSLLSQFRWSAWVPGPFVRSFGSIHGWGFRKSLAHSGGFLGAVKFLRTKGPIQGMGQCWHCLFFNVM